MATAGCASSVACSSSVASWASAGFQCTNERYSRPVAQRYAVWLSEAVPAVLRGTVPPSVQQNGTPTNAVQVLDMAWMLPAFVIAALNLARRTPLGYTLAGAALTFVVLLVLAVVSIVVFAVRAGHPVGVPQVVVFGTSCVGAVILLIWYLNTLHTDFR
jgi:hypothetical protein